MNQIDFNSVLLPAYIINLKARPDRLAHIKSEFNSRPEFELHFIEASKDKIGAVALWKSILKCVQAAIENDEDFIILCKDDHVFTEHYNRDLFIKHIFDAHTQKCDILCGGIGGFHNAIPLGLSRYWIDAFWCTQFIVIYRNLFNAILCEPFEKTDTAEGKFSEITSNKMVLYPFISTRYDFGYSDVTASNNRQNDVISQLSQTASRDLEIYKNVYDRFLARTDTSNKTIFPINRHPKPSFYHDRLAHHESDASEIIPYIQHLLQPKSIVEFGCGTGHFLYAARVAGITKLLGLDGKWTEIDHIKSSVVEFRYAEFDIPIRLDIRYDLAICMEMAEHLESQTADTLVESLVKASNVILFSAAIPGQGGKNHLNEQWPSYWVQKFARHEYSFYDVLRLQFWNNTKVSWYYKQNMFLVIRNDVKHPFRSGAIPHLVHPELYLSKLGIEL